MAHPRIFCIGRNYAKHIEELGNVKPSEPVVFMKPADCLLPPGQTIPYPPHGQQLEHEAEVVLRMGKFFIDGITLGLDLTLRDVQADLKSRSLPWEKAKAFEGSAPLGAFVSPGAVTDLDHLHFRCLVNKQLRQEGDTSLMLFSIGEVVDYLSGIWSLKPGDLIFTGTPAGVGPLLPGDEVVVESKAIGKFAWKVGPKADLAV